MKLLLLGCTGFIGKKLIPKLIEANHELTVISRRKFNYSKKIFPNNHINHIRIDPSLPSSWENFDLLSVLKQSEGIINLAGEPIAEKRWSKTHCRKIFNSRIDTTRFLVKAIKELKKPPAILINASAIGFYGTSQTKEFDENSQEGNDFLGNVCKEWEKAALEKPNRTRLVIVRIGIVLDKEGGALGKMLPIFQAGLGGPIGSGKQWMSWIHRTDLCQIIIQSLINKSWSGTFNAVAPNPVSMNEFTEALGKSINRPSLLKVPEPILKLLLGDGAKVVLEGQKVICNRLKKLKFKFSYPEISLAMKTISEKPLNHKDL
tara:strand:- start:3 stop:956 length:954 start_codon:yes stop_codon:yes gene_type:complete